jgi:hypothetical protein
MVVGGSLKEDVCEMEETKKKETWSTSGKPSTSQGQMAIKWGWCPIQSPPGKQDLPDPFIRWF